jgi:MFS family permease
MELGIPDTKMVFLAYLTLAVALLSLLGRETRTWLRRVDGQRELAVRMAGFAAAVLGVIAAAYLAQDASRRELVPLVGLAAGGCLYALGVLLWRGRGALLLRAAGWGLAVMALAVPSLLTLALPAAALLVVTLGSPPEHRTPSTAQPARS